MCSAIQPSRRAMAEPRPQGQAFYFRAGHCRRNPNRKTRGILIREMADVFFLHRGAGQETSFLPLRKGGRPANAGIG